MTNPPHTDRPGSIPDIVDELIALQREHPEFSLNVFGNRLSAGQYNLLYRRVSESVPSGASVLDWGCGRGHFSYFLLRSGFIVTGFSLDGFPALLQSTGDSFTFAQGNSSDPTSLPFSDGRFDAVFSIGVLEHVRETGGTEAGSLREVWRILKPGGVFICAHLPNRYTWIEVGIRQFAQTRHWHRYRYTPADIRTFWGEAGFEILSVDRYSWLPRNILNGRLSRLASTAWFEQSYDLLETLFKAALFPCHQNFLVTSKKIPAASSRAGNK